MTRAIKVISIVLLTAAVALCDSGSGAGNGSGNGNANGHAKNKQGKTRQSESQNGTYKISIVGTFRGTGTAIVTEDGVSFDVDVVTIDGTKTKFTASKLVTDGPYFRGTATGGGHTLTVDGRLDAANGSRLTATYVCAAGGDVGRIVGGLPKN